MKKELKEHLRRKLNQSILNEVSLHQDDRIELYRDSPIERPGETSPVPSYNPFSQQYYNQDIRQLLQWYYQNDPDTAPRVIWNLQHGYPWWHGIDPSAWPPEFGR